MVRGTLKAWERFVDTTDNLLRPIEDDQHYDQVADFLDELLEKAKEKPSPKIEGLIDYVSQLIGEYDQTQVQIPEAEPRAVLALLMEQQGLKQIDLSSIVPQSVLSQILSGKRQINSRQAKALGEFFGVSPAVFL